MAIESVYIQTNTSIVQDEVLSHRLGLVPIKADPRLFDMITGDEDATDLNTLVFKLDVSCTDADFADPNAPVMTSGPETKHVYSGDFEWQPQGLQLERFPEGLAPVEGDILLAALRSGQQIQVETHCVKGIGRDHAKFSPVATASYRLLPG
jgi:DNA-directed RNA polymerase I and III subunit RPAC1